MAIPFKRLHLKSYPVSDDNLGWAIWYCAKHQRDSSTDTLMWWHLLLAASKGELK